MGGTQGLDVTFRRSREIGTGKQSTDTAVDSGALSRERFSLVTWIDKFQSGIVFGT